MQQLSERAQAFRAAITRFVRGRLAEKKKTPAEDLGGSAANWSEVSEWLADAARRVKGIQMVTHPLKATYPDAKINETTSLYCPGESLPQREEIGSHDVLHDIRDVSGDAAALGAYKLLKVEIDGRPLLDWLQDEDSDAIAALSDDRNAGLEWSAAFKDLIRSKPVLASHSGAKQLYWCINEEPTDDVGYHLLQPLFSSSLAHAVHTDISDARFSEASKTARQAKRDKKAYDGTLKDYRNLVIRKLGGTKPQNISQLNTDRRGVNYLLASLPPQWKQDRPRNFLNAETALARFENFEGVRGQLRALVDLLGSNPPPTVETRDARKRIERALGESLAAFGLATRQLFEPGWTRDESCELPLCEQLWLDPERSDLPPRPDHIDDDTAFVAAFEWKGWPDEVASRFGNWLNAYLQTRGLPVGDAEHAHWARQAILDAEWPAPMQRHATRTAKKAEVAHG